ncbi:MAG TPA: ABC transporter permease [Anaerovoracaceae bacterium]|nr:ABC transporter permease [Anaerovoracaceae bacterium]
MGKRVVYSILTFLLVTVIIFTIFQFIPGDPVLSKIGLEPDPALEESLRAEFGLDKPVLERYFNWLFNLVKLDMGTSIRYGLPVNELIASRLPNTVGLAVLSFLIVVIAGIPLGIVVARHNESRWGIIFNALTQVGIAIPSFFFAMILILVISIKLQLLPVSAYAPISKGIIPFLKGMLLPAVAVSFSGVSITVRYVRSSIVEELNSDYVLAAKNKGVKEKDILYRHVLRNAMIPIVTILGMIFVSIVTGSIIIETVFSIPGIGSLLIAAIKTSDLPLTQGICVYISIVVISAYLLLDILYMIIDPRIRLKE